MAKGGPVISAGPAIASPRGGAPFGAKVGGIEGSRPISLSPADLKINSLFGPAIISPSQIGFKPYQPQGFESVKPLTPLKNPFPERGESGNATIRYTEPVKAQKETRTIPVFKTAERPDIARIAQQHEFAKRVRANLTRLTAARVRTGIVTRIETSAAFKTQVQPQVGTAPETATRTIVSTGPKPEVKAGRQLPDKVRTQVGNFEQGSNSRRELDLTRRYIGKDLKTNNSRLEALTSIFEQLNGSSVQGVVDGAVLARESEIGTARSFRSRLLEQRGYNRDDGSQRRIELELTAKANVGRGQLEELVEANSAVEATDDPPLKLATQDEVTKVLTPPKSPVTIEPVIVEEVTEKLVETRKVVEASGSVAQPVQIFGEPKINDIEKVEAGRDNIVIFPSRLLDMGEYINSGEENEVFKRRQLILAA